MCELGLVNEVGIAPTLSVLQTDALLLSYSLVSPCLLATSEGNLGIEPNLACENRWMLPRSERGTILELR